jgi:hypothetical protein
MPPIRPCYPARPVRAADLSLRGPEDALSVLLAGGGDRPRIVCLLLDVEHRGLHCLEVTGPSDAEGVFQVAELLLRAVTNDTDLAALVVASFRPGQSHLPEPGEPSAFFELRELFADAGIDVLDWFLVAGGRATSLAELSEAAWLWRMPPDARPA